MRFFKDFDFLLVIPSLLVLSIGLIILSSIDFELFKAQLVFSILGLGVFLFFSSINIRALQNLGSIFYFSSLLLLLSLFLFGVDVRGARRWVELFGFRMQFSEPIKPFLILSFSSLLTKWQEKITLLPVLLATVLFLPVLFFLFRQPDLGSALIYGVTFIGMLLSAGMSSKYFIGGVALLTLLLPGIFKILASYQQNRIVTFFNPKHDPQGLGYNAIQSAIAVGSGLLFGRGLGRGVQSQLQFLPERHTDFIFASFSEEFGFVGSLLVLMLYFILLLRILQIARNQEEPFASYACFGIFILLLSQVFINIGMNMGLVPITGVTLPLLSYGGSSLISTMIMLGIVAGVKRQTSQKSHVLEIR